MPGSDLSLQFRVFGIPVQVSLFFLIMAVLLGRGFVNSPGRLVAWVLIVFVSVLLHELGHALVARLFGQQPYITLHAMGGLTTWRVSRPLSPGQRFAVAFAGPAAGVVLAVFAVLIGGLFFARGSTGRELLGLAAGVNIGWAVLNLLPMLPLDGGNVAAALADLVTPGRGRRFANYLSVLTAIVAGAWALLSGMFLFALICGFAVWLNVRELRLPPPPPASAAVIDVPAEPLPREETPPPRET